MDIILWSFPIFLVLVGIEALSSRYDESKKYRLNDTLSNMSCGIFDQVVNAGIGTFVIGIYMYIYTKAAVFQMSPKNPLSWILLLVGIDLAYYCFHRACHRINLLWGAHIVHHQSESYNMTVSLRQGTVATWVGYIFYLPLAILGFSAPMFLIMNGLYQLYQFLVHTNLIKTLGPLESFIATPELHRVHHSRDEKYLDKNYGGLFIFWDKMFKSFAPMKETPQYGITTGVQSWNPLWANIHYYVHLWKSSRAKKDWKTKLKIWFAAPADTRDIVLPVLSQNGYNSTIDRKHLVLAILQIALTVSGAFFLLYKKGDLATLQYIFASLTVLLSLINVNGLFEKAKWIVKSQILLFIFFLITLYFFLV